MWGAPAALDARHRRLLILLGAASFFEGYDLNIVIVALPQLRATFGLTQSMASLWISLLYLGALPALFLARRADRFGRRRVLLVSITGYTIATAATALAPSIGMFAICQLLARAFLAVELAVTWTLVTEELPAGHRGYGFGVLATMNALGTGWGSLSYALILAPHHASWRWLYAAAVPVLIAVTVMRRQLPEGRRFTQAAATGALAPTWRAAFRPPHRRTLTLVCAMAILVNLLTQSTVFVVDFMQTQRHLSPSAANLILVVAGATAIPTLVGAGKLSDRIGRKTVGCAFLGLSVIGALGFFFLAHGSAMLYTALTLTYIGQFGAWPTLSGFGTELFPTPVRALARSTVGVAQVTGQAGSFVLAAALIAVTGALDRTVAILALGPILGIVLVTTSLPETAKAELDDPHDATAALGMAELAALPSS